MDRPGKEVERGLFGLLMKGYLHSRVCTPVEMECVLEYDANTFHSAFTTASKESVI